MENNVLVHKVEDFISENVLGSVSTRNQPALIISAHAQMHKFKDRLKLFVSRFF